MWLDARMVVNQVYRHIKRREEEEIHIFIWFNRHSWNINIWYIFWIANKTNSLKWHNTGCYSKNKISFYIFNKSNFPTKLKLPVHCEKKVCVELTQLNLIFWWITKLLKNKKNGSCWNFLDDLWEKKSDYIIMKGIKI